MTKQNRPRPLHKPDFGEKNNLLKHLKRGSYLGASLIPPWRTFEINQKLCFASRAARAGVETTDKPPKTKRKRTKPNRTGAETGAEKSAAYETNRKRSRDRSMKISAAGREIGPLPEIINPQRRTRARRNLKRFLDVYFGEVFCLAWSPDHTKAIQKIQTSILRGGLYAFAMPRGSGKTSLVECAAIWALLYGHRRFVVLVGADLSVSQDNLASIKTHLELNPLIADDFPEVVHPIRALERVPHRAGGQILNGRPTLIGWKADEVVLPSVEGSTASAGAIRVAGITGRIRGTKFTRPDGSVVRPDFCLIDDPQTDESARSPSQVETRAATIKSAILGLAGPGKNIAGFCACTVLEADDVAARLLDKKQNPEWQGTRTKLLRTMPTDKKKWAEYATIRADALAAGKGIAPATAFYKANRRRLDRGAKAGWPARFATDEASAIQHAMNLFYQDQTAFYCDYQNDPAAAVKQTGLPQMTARQIAAKTNGIARGAVPLWADHLSAFVDVQGEVLFWLVSAWRADFTGAVVNYGTFPDQGAGYFSLRDLRRTLSKQFPGAREEGRINAGLAELVGGLMGGEFVREDGAEMRLGRLLVDGNWQTETIYNFCRSANYGAGVMPAHGRYVGASSSPFVDYKRKTGELVGLNWRVAPKTNRATRSVLFDSNFWKSFIERGLQTATGDPGSLSLCDGTEREHRMIGDHLRAEYKVETTGRGRSVFEWKLRPGAPDNHWLDCLVGSAVAASMLGAALPGVETPRRTKRKRPRVSYMKG